MSFLGWLGSGSVGGTREELKVELLLLRVQSSQLRWFGHLVRTPPQWLPGEVLPCGRPGEMEPPQWPGNALRSSEWLVELAGERSGRASPLRLLPHLLDPEMFNSLQWTLLGFLFFGHFNKKKGASSSSSSFKSLFRVTLFTAHQNSSYQLADEACHGQQHLMMRFQDTWNG